MTSHATSSRVPRCPVPYTARARMAPCAVHATKIDETASLGTRVSSPHFKSIRQVRTYMPYWMHLGKLVNISRTLPNTRNKMAFHLLYRMKPCQCPERVLLMCNQHADIQLPLTNASKLVCEKIAAQNQEDIITTVCAVVLFVLYSLVGRVGWILTAGRPIPTNPCPEHCTGRSRPVESVRLQKASHRFDPPTPSSRQLWAARHVVRDGSLLREC